MNSSYDNNDFDYIDNDNTYLGVGGARGTRISLWRIFFGMLFYLVALSLLADLFGESLNLGLTMILSTVAPLAILYKIVPYRSFGEIINYKKESIDFRKIVYFFGLIFASNLIFGKIISLIIDLFSLNVENVMDNVMMNMGTATFIYVVIIGPIVEELVYRGFLLQNLSRRNYLGALVISTLSFALMHGNFDQALSLLGLSFIINYVGLNYSWKAALLLHLLNNANSIFISLTIEKLGEESSLLVIWMLALIILSIYSLVTFIKTGYKEMAERIRFNNGDKKESIKLIFSPAMLSLIAVYLVLVFLSIN